MVFDVVHDGPEESDEFTGDGDDGNVRGFLGADTVVDLVESMLSFPAVETHLRSLSARLATALLDLGLPVVGGPPGPRLAHIVSVGQSGGGRHYTADDPAMNALHQYLMENGVRHSIRSGVLRLSVGVHNNEADIDRAVELAERWIQSTGHGRRRT